MQWSFLKDRRTKSTQRTFSSYAKYKRPSRKHAELEKSWETWVIEMWDALTSWLLIIDEKSWSLITIKQQINKSLKGTLLNDKSNKLKDGQPKFNKSTYLNESAYLDKNIISGK